MGALVGMIYMFVFLCAFMPVYMFCDWYFGERKKGQSFKEYCKEF